MFTESELQQFQQAWQTHMGAWFKGERVVFRGKDLFTDMHNLPWIGVLLYGITGCIPSPTQIKLFEGIWRICTSYPDPRIWNNRIAALAGTTRSTAALAIGAATAVSEATIYGRRPDIRSIDFLLRAQQQRQQGIELIDIIKQELKLHRGIMGYGRPVINGDERIAPMKILLEELALLNGNYVQLAFEIESILLNGRWRMQMNAAALSAGACADQGLSPTQYYQYLTLSFSAGMFPCYQDAVSKPPQAFFPFSIDDIQYKGPAPRKWPC